MQVKFVSNKFFFNLRDFLSTLVVGVTRWKLVNDKGQVNGGKDGCGYLSR